ncbi:hypothetical protein HELRODRAFT_172565 [Helobdella robusta]|uniref:Uncharacterized protein n=1 Tax=Helobdella robusta TaxID=6412 RepID=T1F5I9_HELRO|nr:hypothetical protein HELRODRAFT_172565 [Helobdella robusta]ESO04215.1 hypothetical protein HELRODRAFT_172565 [Helobdella robusta]
MFSSDNKIPLNRSSMNNFNTSSQINIGKNKTDNGNIETNKKQGNNKDNKMKTRKTQVIVRRIRNIINQTSLYLTNNSIVQTALNKLANQTSLLLANDSSVQQAVNKVANILTFKNLMETIKTKEIVKQKEAEVVQQVKQMADDMAFSYVRIVKNYLVSICCSVGIVGVTLCLLCSLFALSKTCRFILALVGLGLAIYLIVYWVY